MQVAIQLPEDIAEDLLAKWKDLPRHALEAIALEGYRSGALTESQVRRVLGFETRLEVNSFLKDRGVYYNYSLALRATGNGTSPVAEHPRRARGKPPWR
jgi:uncharacterized protein UPF0175